jgi:monofunctional biosynthetic peptidoglycan transglycosylase
MHRRMKALLRLIACLVVAGVALELFFVVRIAAMAVVAPQSTAFQRSEAWQIAIHQGSEGGWRQQWVPYGQINDTLKRAVIASEDAGFVDHNGVEWEAIERARQRKRKGQELVLATLLEVFLDKQRILALYLNNVEWGEGVFGAEAASQYYFRKPASRLSANEAARLAVMLPSPKFFERRPGSPYLSSRASTVMARMSSAELP